MLKGESKRLGESGGFFCGNTLINYIATDIIYYLNG